MLNLVYPYDTHKNLNIPNKFPVLGKYYREFSNIKFPGIRPSPVQTDLIGQILEMDHRQEKKIFDNDENC